MFKNSYQKRDTLAQISGILSFIMLLMFVFVSIYYGDKFAFIENWNLIFPFIMILISLLASIFFLIIYMKNSSSAIKMENLLSDNFWTEKATIMIENFNDYQLDKALNIARNYENKKNEKLFKEIDKLKDEFNI